MAGPATRDLVSKGGSDANRLLRPRPAKLTARGGDGWLKALRLDDYAPRAPRRPGMLQQALFAHTDAV